MYCDGGGTVYCDGGGIVYCDGGGLHSVYIQCKVYNILDIIAQFNVIIVLTNHNRNFTVSFHHSICNSV